TPENVQINGITQELSIREYYLVFYYDVHALLDRFIRKERIKLMQYSNFYELKEIGAGGYGTVYTAKYKGEEKNIPTTVVLKRFKSDDDETQELFMSEVSNNQ